MNKGALISLIVGLAAMAAVVGAFLTSASPYVTIAEARRSRSSELHIAGTIVPGTIRQNRVKKLLQFTLRDDSGATIRVDYNGDFPENLSQAKKIVAIGGVQDGRLLSSQLLVKCPSKYQSSKSSS